MKRLIDIKHDIDCIDKQLNLISTEINKGGILNKTALDSYTNLRNQLIQESRFIQLHMRWQ